MRTGNRILPFLTRARHGAAGEKRGTRREAGRPRFRTAKWGKNTRIKSLIFRARASRRIRSTAKIVHVSIAVMPDFAYVRSICSMRSTRSSVFGSVTRAYVASERRFRPIKADGVRTDGRDYGRACQRRSVNGHRFMTNEMSGSFSSCFMEGPTDTHHWRTKESH